jgi:hypothetical protein
MGQRGGSARLLLEPAHPVRIGGQGRGNDLDGDVPSQPGVVSLVDLAHAASTDRARDFVRADTGAGG